MINNKDRIAAALAGAVEGLSREEIRDMIEIPADSRMGDYAFPCFRLAKMLRKAPPMIALGVAEKLQGNELFEKVENVNAYQYVPFQKSVHEGTACSGCGRKGTLRQQRYRAKPQGHRGILIPEHCKTVSYRAYQSTVTAIPSIKK
jgi:hypothetical protein